MTKTAARRPKADTNLFRFRRVGPKYVVTNDHGAFAFLDETQLANLVEGRVNAGSALYKELRGKGFLLEPGDLDKVADDYDRKVSFLYRGTVLHILVVTLRCNEVCAYCHASRADMKATENDMSIATSEKVVDLIMRAPTDTLTVEFQGGEPLANWEVVQHVVEYGTVKAQEAGKRVMFSLVSNLSLMDDEKLAYILEKRIQVSTSLDGPKDLHDKYRKLSKSSAYDKTVYWMDRINQAYRDAGLDPTLYHVEALMTVTREHLGRAKDLVDEYVARGCRAIFLRPLNPFGYAKHTGLALGYTGKEFLAFYREALDHILTLNRQGVEILERLAAIFLTKILTPDDPNYLDIRSPCGAGVGQIAYNHDGTIFTCDEGRMMFQMGDEAFKIGTVDSSSLRDLVTHDAVKALLMASTLDSLPLCSDCAYKPYCGTCPVYNYGEHGNIFPQNPTNQRCAIYMGVQDRLFELLQSDDADLRAILERWVVVKDRPEYVHDGR
jgi:His-Xaa-Ser system radical SAM maturase HxsB